MAKHKRRVPLSSRLTGLFVLVLLHETCSAKPTPNCTSSCGDIRNISYPFRLKDDPKACGRPEYTLSCENNHVVVDIGARKYYVRQINYDNNTIRVVDSGTLQDNNSFIPRYFQTRYDMGDSYWVDSEQSKSVVLWICEKPLNSPLYYHLPACFDDGEHSSNSSFSHSKGYRYVRVGRMNLSEMEDFCQIEGMFLTSWPGNDGPNISCSDLLHRLQYGFELHTYREGFWAYPLLWAIGWVIILFLIIIGMYHVAITILGTPLVIALLIRKWHRRHLSMYNVIEEYLQTHNNLMPIRYSYSEIKKMTKSFKEKLGEGGYGTVYKGTLRSGHLVAIKMLGKSKGNGQDFINEVATVGRIYHVNVVQLIGFSVEGSKRALVYEFMPNGSLNKHIFLQEASILLSYKRIYSIALGIAYGIDYLHEGCDMQILHFDIKPHNILLDENLIPKLSDFGLAKLFPTNKSIMSLTAARGTIGYMAPELFYKNIGGVSYKADIYSFGMLLMEMVGKRKNVNAFVEHSSQVYFPNWVYDQLHQGKNIEIEEHDEEEKQLVKKMVIVALWCIQMKPIERPSMSKVVEMLEGEVQSLQMPPKPSLQSLESFIIKPEENSHQISSSYQLKEPKLDEVSMTVPPAAAHFKD